MPLNVVLFGNKVKLRSVGKALVQFADILTKGRNLDTWVQTAREVEVEMGCQAVSQSNALGMERTRARFSFAAFQRKPEPQRRPGVPLKTLEP